LDRGVIIAVAVAGSVGFVTLSYLELAGYDPYFATDYITREDYAAEELHGPMVYFVFETLSSKLFCGCVIGAELHAYKRRVQALQLDRERRIAAAARLAERAGLETATMRAQVERDATAYFFHEFRGDLNLVKGALAEVPAAQRTRLLESAARGVEHMASLVNRIMDMSKLRAGELVLPRAPFSPRALCHEVALAMRAAHPALSITLSVGAGVHGDNNVMGSRLHLAQVLKNLAGNACKFTARKYAGRDAAGGQRPRGGHNGRVRPGAMPGNRGSVRITVAREGARHRFSVEDNGPGIPPGAQTAVFDKYHQAGLQPGTGLGLPISQSLVALMGDGDRPAIAVTSPWPAEAGNAGGTRFSFSVEFPGVDAAGGGGGGGGVGGNTKGAAEAGAMAAAAAAAAADEEAAAALLRASTGRVLIADDEEMPVEI